MDKSISLLINKIETNMHENILDLDHKLKTLRAEIEAKLHQAEEEHLLHLIEEVNQAIQAISHVVSLTSQ